MSVAPDKENILIAQYNRASNDYRHFDQLIWQVPSVSITITSVIFAVSFGFIRTNFIVMGLILTVGGIFDFTLLIALSKYRLMQDVRVKWMEQIEKQFDIISLPVSTKSALSFLSEIEHKHVSIGWFRRRNAFKFLFYTIFILFVFSVIVGAYLLYVH
ncbi:MAG: hypothetical protein QXT72_03875 [Candidatus Micrarchaeia archaeon]